jgi:predicted GIY-YIG superfamily endonuclease
MSFWVYMLRCGDGSLYTGHTDDLERRIASHWAGTLGKYTASRHPLTLAWAAAMPSRDEALVHERQIKGWSRAKKEALIASDWERVAQLAKSTSANR